MMNGSVMNDLSLFYFCLKFNIFSPLTWWRIRLELFRFTTKVNVLPFVRFVQINSLFTRTMRETFICIRDFSRHFSLFEKKKTLVKGQMKIIRWWWSHLQQGEAGKKKITPFMSVTWLCVVSILFWSAYIQVRWFVMWAERILETHFDPRYKEKQE